MSRPSTAPAPAPTPPPPLPARFDRVAAVVLIALVIAPVVVLAIAASRASYTPVGDEATIVQRAADVGSSLTPMVGAYSTRGWAHPGPALFWFLAPMIRLGGPSSALAATALLHAATIALIGWVGWRRGGLALVAILTAGLGVLLHGLRPETLISFWNPYVPLLVYVLFLLAVWSVSRRDVAILPVAVIAGSVVVQMHVAYVTLVGAAAAAGLFLWWWDRPEPGIDPGRGPRSSPPPDRRSARRAAVWSSLAFAILWLPVLWDLVFGSRNGVDLFRYFRDSDHETAGFATGFGILSRHLGPGAPWMGGEELMAFGNVLPGSMVPLLLVFGIAGVLLVWAHRLRLGAVRSLLVLVLTQVLVAGFALSRLEPPLLAYLVVWLLPLALFVWVGIGWSAVQVFSAERARRRMDGPELAASGARTVDAASSPDRRPSWVRSVAVGAAALVAVVSIASEGSGWWRPRLPRSNRADAVASIREQLSTHDFGSVVRVEIVGELFAEATVGVLAGIMGDDRQVVTTDGALGQKWGADRTWTGQEVDETITVAFSAPFADVDPVAVCAADPAVRMIASYDGLAAGERQEMDRLALENFERNGDLSPTDTARYQELLDRAPRVAVFTGDTTCAGAGAD